MRIERELSTNLGEKVVLYVYPPIEGDRNDEFFCIVGLEGAGINKTSKIYGIDPMQALLLSIRHLSGFLERGSASIHPRRLVWDLGEEGDEFGLIT